MHPLVIPFFIPHAGCPHTCIFCDQRLVSGAREPLPSPERIKQTIRVWLQRSPGRTAEVAFYGGSFSLLPLSIQNNLLDAVREFLENGSVGGIRISTRPDALDHTVLRFLKIRGVKTIEVGVQSLHDQVLIHCNRGHSAHDALEAITRVSEAGFSVGVQLLPGLPGDSRQFALQSVHAAIAAGAQFFRIYPAVVLAGTGLADLYKNGAYLPPDLEQGIQTCARMVQICLKNNIPVIRIGLQADTGLQQEHAVLAGCWHPALGQMVYSELFYDLVCSLVSNITVHFPLTVVCHPRRVSEVIGNRRHNLQRLAQQGIAVQQVLTDHTVEPDTIILKNMLNNLRGSIITDLNYEGESNA